MLGRYVAGNWVTDTASGTYVPIGPTPQVVVVRELFPLANERPLRRDFSAGEAS